MRMRTVAVLVSIVLVLAAVTAWALMPRKVMAAGPSFDAALARLTPESLQFIEVVQGDGSPLTRIEQDPATRQWLIRSGQESPWPVVASRPRALAGLLAEVAKSGGKASSEPASATYRVVRVAWLDGTARATRELLVDSSALGGRTSVHRRDEQGAWTSAHADSAFASLFTRASLNAWADTHALVDVGQTASKIRLECADGRVELARLGARWTIVSPKLGNADAQAVTALLQQLGDFARVTSASPRSASDANSVFVAAVTCELPGGASLEQVISVPRDGVAPDTVEGQAYARTDRGDGARVWAAPAVRIDRAKFDAISADPAKYVARIATEVPRADIAIIRVARDSSAMDASRQLTPLTAADAAGARSVTLSTSGAAWRITPMTSTGAGEPAARGVAATPEQEKWIGQLRDLLTSTRAASVSMARDTQAKGELVLTLASPSGAPLDAIAVGVSSEKGAPRVVVRRGNVYLMYDTGAALVEWLERQLPPEG